MQDTGDMVYFGQPEDRWLEGIATFVLYPTPSYTI